jgi:hypothetical protein
VKDVDRPEYDLDTSGTFLSSSVVCLLNSEDRILLRREDCKNPDPLLRVEWSIAVYEYE